jgi:hypothetical protein
MSGERKRDECPFSVSSTRQLDSSQNNIWLVTFANNGKRIWFTHSLGVVIECTLQD